MTDAPRDLDVPGDFDAARDADVLRQAAQANREDELREGATLIFPNYGQVVVTGDLHGHRRNLERLRKYCGARHVILHEIIHEELNGFDDLDLSFVALLEAARWKCEFPDQVHFLQSNHELAQLVGHEISKNGRIVTADFEAGVRSIYGADTPRVMDAVYDLIASYPLAGRTPHGVLFSHSVPGPRDLPLFDAGVLERKPTEDDLDDHGSAYVWVWGRYQTPESLDLLREMLGVELFICGHQPQEEGWAVLHDRMLILASDHNHGVFLPIDLSKPCDLERLTQQIRPLAELA
jgi:hypothetical protein